LRRTGRRDKSQGKAKVKVKTEAKAKARVEENFEILENSILKNKIEVKKKK